MNDTNQKPYHIDPEPNPDVYSVYPEQQGEEDRPILPYAQV